MATTPQNNKPPVATGKRYSIQDEPCRVNIGGMAAADKQSKLKSPMVGIVQSKLPRLELGLRVVQAIGSQEQLRGLPPGPCGTSQALLKIGLISSCAGQNKGRLL